MWLCVVEEAVPLQRKMHLLSDGRVYGGYPVGYIGWWGLAPGPMAIKLSKTLNEPPNSNKDTHPSGDAVEHIIPTNRTHIYELLYLNGSRAGAFYNYIYLRAVWLLLEFYFGVCFMGEWRLLCFLYGFINIIEGKIYKYLLFLVLYRLLKSMGDRF